MGKFPLILIIALYIFNNIENTVKGQEIKLCETRECRQLSEEFTKAMNKSTDPCENFYEYTCGNWAINNPRPNFAIMWNKDKSLQLHIDELLSEELRKNVTSSDILPTRQMKQWYQSCINEKDYGSESINKINSILMQIGGWPMVMDQAAWNPKKFKLEEIETYYFGLTNHFTFLRLEANEFHSNQSVIAPPVIPLDKLLPIRSSSRNGLQFYRSLLNYVAPLFIASNQANITESQLQQDIDDVIRVLQKILKALGDAHEFSGRNEQFDLVNELRYFPSLSNKPRNITSILLNFFNSTGLPRNGILHYRDYFESLVTLFESTDERTIVNYIHWNFVIQFLYHVNDQFRSKFWEFVEDATRERQVYTPRWYYCLKEIPMKDALELLFIEKYFSNETETAVIKMSEKIRTEVENQINQSTWLKPATKVSNTKILNQQKGFFGGPDASINQERVMNHSRQFVVSDDYLDNLMSFMKLKHHLILHPWVDVLNYVRKSWLRDPTSVWQYYDEIDKMFCT